MLILSRLQVYVIQLFNPVHLHRSKQHLQVDVAHKLALGIHHLANRGALSASTHLQPVIESAKRQRWVVEEVDASSNGVLASLQVLVLPDPPGAIDLSVVQPEHGVSGGDEEVSTGVATDGVVTTSVDTEEAVEEGHAVNDTLHSVLEGADFLVVGDQVGDTGIGEPLGGDPLADVAGEAAWRVAEEAGIGDLGSIRGGGRWGDVDDPVLEGAGLDAAATGSRGDAVHSVREGGGTVMCGEDAVSAHGVGGAIKVGRVDGVGGGLAPVPVLWGVRKAYGNIRIGGLTGWYPL